MHRKQQGQAFILGIALLLFVGLTAVMLFNTGQTVTEKTRVVNTADSAAFSGLLWQARALNFQAYTNRAMVANQVAMAQAVSLKSWGAYSQKASERIEAALGLIPYVGQVAIATAKTFRAVNAVMSPVSEAMMFVIDSINGVLSASQQAMYLATFVATPEVIQNVVKSNNAKFEWDTAFSLGGAALNLNDWSNFTDQYTKDDTDAMQERVDMINLSTDRFTRSRNWDFFSFWFPKSLLSAIRFEKRGETRLLQSADGETYEWKAKDTLTFKTRLFRPIVRDKLFETTKIGYAEAYANNASGQRSIEQCGHGELCNNWYGNEKTQLKAQRSGPSKMRASYGGVRAYRSLSKAIRSSEEDPSLVLRVEVNVPDSTITDSQELGLGGRFAEDISAPGSIMSSVSTAELFYERPNSQDLEDGIEYANGYNAFWDVRLMSTPNTLKLAAFAARGDFQSIERNALSDLPGFKLATPLSDYSAQLAVVGDVVGDAREAIENMDLSGFVSDTAGSAVQQIAAAQQADLSDGVFDLATEQANQFSGDNFSSFTGQLTSEHGDVAGEVNDVIKDQLTNVLKDALRNILKSITGTAPSDSEIASAIENDGAGLIDDIDTGTNSINVNADIAKAENHYSPIEALYAQIRDNVYEKFKDAVTRVESSRTETILFLDSEKIRLREILRLATDDKERDRIRSEISGNATIRNELDDKIKEDLSVELLEIVKAEAPDLDFDIAKARDTVDSLLDLVDGSLPDLIDLLNAREDEE